MRGAGRVNDRAMALTCGVSAASRLRHDRHDLPGWIRMHRHLAFAMASAAIGCSQLSEPVSDVATPSFVRVGSTRYEIIDLGTLGGGSSSSVGVNGRGEVAGESAVTSGVLHAFV